MSEHALFCFPYDARPCAADNVGIDYIGTDIEGVVTGRDRNFCAVPLSAYRSEAFSDIWQFEITYSDGSTQPVYCLEKGARGPGGERYHSMPIEQCLPALSAEQIARINWVFANSYPVVEAARLFECAGVEALASPALTPEDAYAATQIALWSVIDPPADPDSGWRFLDCEGGAPHAKSVRLHSVVSYLYDASIVRAEGKRSTLNTDGTDVGLCEMACGCRVARVGSATLTDCGAGEPARACGKILYGPLMVCSDAPFTLTLKPLCTAYCTHGFIGLADGCGNSIRMPASGQEFYIAFPPKTPASCYELALYVERKVATVAVMCSAVPSSGLQAIGAAPKVSTRRDCASLCLCFSPPCEPCCPVPCCAVPCCPRPEPCVPRAPEPCHDAPPAFAHACTPHLSHCAPRYTRSAPPTPRNRTKPWADTLSRP